MKLTLKDLYNIQEVIKENLNLMLYTEQTKKTLKKLRTKIKNYIDILENQEV